MNVDFEFIFEKCWFINNSQRVIALNENFTLLLKFLFCNVTAF